MGTCKNWPHLISLSVPRSDSGKAVRRGDDLGQHNTSYITRNAISEIRRIQEGSRIFGGNSVFDLLEVS